MTDQAGVNENDEIYTVAYTVSHCKILSRSETVSYELTEGIAVKAAYMTGGQC